MPSPTRLMARGVSPVVMQPVRVDSLNLATPAQTSARFFSMLPMILILILLIALTLAPMALFASALQMFVATFARSFKEAQTYVNLMLFVPMLPGLVTMVYPLESAFWMRIVPALSQQLVVIDIMGGEPAVALSLIVSGVATTSFALLLLAPIARLLGREKIVFGRV